MDKINTLLNQLENTYLKTLQTMDEELLPPGTPQTITSQQYSHFNFLMQKFKQNTKSIYNNPPSQYNYKCYIPK